MDLDKKYGILRTSKFAIASGIGFLVIEVILAIGTLVLYPRGNVPKSEFASPTILALNVLAFGIGITVSFFINERVTVRNQGAQRHPGFANLVKRLLKFQLTSLLGDVIIVLVQLFLLAELGLTPAVGSIVGAIVSYPISYFISMKFVWRLHPVHAAQEVAPHTEPNTTTT